MVPIKSGPKMDNLIPWLWICRDPCYVCGRLGHLTCSHRRAIVVQTAKKKNNNNFFWVTKPGCIIESGGSEMLWAMIMFLASIRMLLWFLQQVHWQHSLMSVASIGRTTYPIKVQTWSSALNPITRLWDVLDKPVQSGEVSSYNDLQLVPGTVPQWTLWTRGLVKSTDWTELSWWDLRNIRQVMLWLV